MDKFKTTPLGGLPFVLDDIRQFLGRLTAPANHGIYQAFNNILGGFGTDFIVQGCVLSGSTGAFSITEGWILLSGELIKVDAQGPFDEASDSTFTKVTTFDPRGNKDFLNGSNDDTYEKNRGVISGLAGTLAFNGNTFSDLRSIGVKSGVDTPILTTILEIGNWDMDTTSSVGITAGLPTLSKIRRTQIMIFNDVAIDTVGFDVNSLTRAGDFVYRLAPPLQLLLTRDGSGLFDSGAYNDGSINRGFITIDFEG